MGKISSLTRRKILEPLFLWTRHSPKISEWKELEKTQYFSEAQLLEIQWQRLEEMLRFVWENNTFYNKRFQELGLKTNDIRAPEDLQRLPLLTKSEIRNNTPEMISRGYDIKKLQKAKTGGSTGTALELYFTEKCSELRNACGRRHDRWTGWEPGEPIAACWGNPNLPKTIKEKLRHSLFQPVIYLDTMSVNESSVMAFVEEWKRIRPTMLYGHSHSLFLLAQYLKILGIDILRPKGIISTSMMLIPSDRKVIEEVFGVRVIDRYGCEEVGLIGCECEKHEGMHLNIEHLFIEIVKEDGSYATAGNPGRIIVTDLLNTAMPLIRYQVEDIGVPSDKKCSCGRGLPLMEHLTGRVADFLIKKDGTRVAGVSLIENTLTYFPGLDQMQIIQNGYEEFQVRIVPGVSFDSDVTTEIKKYFEKIFSNSVNVEFILVKKIQQEKSGKYRFTISNIK